MNIILDTHVTIWLDNDPGRLSQRAAGLIADPKNVVFLSVASIWEMQIKVQLGKLRLQTSVPTLVNGQFRDNRILLLPIKPEHIYGLEKLPAYHKDPFDRLLVSQAMVEAAALLTDDTVIQKYPIQMIW